MQTIIEKECIYYYPVESFECCLDPEVFIFDMDFIVKTVVKETGFTQDDMKSQSRKRKLVIARQLIIYFSMFLKYKPADRVIGEYINREHATVLHNRRMALKMISTKDKLFLDLYNPVNEILKKYIDENK